MNLDESVDDEQDETKRHQTHTYAYNFVSARNVKNV